MPHTAATLTPAVRLAPLASGIEQLRRPQASAPPTRPPEHPMNWLVESARNTGMRAGGASDGRGRGLAATTLIDNKLGIMRAGGWAIGVPNTMLEL